VAGISEQIIYRKMREGVYKTRKNEHGDTLIRIEVPGDVMADYKDKTLVVKDEELHKDIETVKEFFTKEIETNKQAMNQYLEHLKESQDKALSIKDEQIEYLKEEIARLRKKGFFARLFGG